MTDLELNLLAHAQAYSKEAADLIEESISTSDTKRAIATRIAAGQALSVLKVFISMAKVERHGLTDMGADILIKLEAEIETLEKALK